MSLLPSSTPSVLSVSILGCGWLGFPLAQSLQLGGVRVRGSVTGLGGLDRLQGAGVAGVQVRFPVDDGVPAELLGSDAVVISLPPRVSEDEGEEYLEALRQIADEMSGSRLILLSSISVYASQSGPVDETTVPSPFTPSGEVCWRGENIIQEADRWVVLRLGGLVGPERHPGKFLAGRQGLPNGNAPVNLVHQNDAVRAIETVLTSSVSGEVYNIVCDDHRPKNVFYPLMAESLGLEAPTFVADHLESDQYRVVSNSKLKKELDFQFEVPLLNSAKDSVLFRAS